MPLELILLAWCAVCGYQDLTRLRVSNLLTLGGAAAASVFLLLAGHSLTGHPPGVALAAGLLGLLLTGPGYWLGKLGAADVKLMIALGLASDPTTVLYTLALGSLICVALMVGSQFFLNDSDNAASHFKSQLARLKPSRNKSFPFISALFAGLLTYMSFIQ